VVDNVSPAMVNDFSGEVDADIIDCQDNNDELQIPEIGDKKSVVGKHEEPPAPPAKPAPTTPTAPSEIAPAVTEPTTAGEPIEIIYPVKELGNCADKDTCKVYCEEPGNMQSCVNFAEKYNLISKEEAEDGRKFSSIVNSRGGGPGGCKTRESCEAYCEDTDNIDACLAFAEDSNLVPAKDLEDMRKVAKLLKEGEKFPGGCKSKSQCEAYCADPNHMEACLVFAEKAGFIPPEELEMAKKVVPLMKAGKTPGGCKSKEACETYCENPDHLDACVAFGEQVGAISPEEVAMIKKTGGKGPGDCRGRQQCEAFCQISENQETCFNFGKEHGIIPEEDLKQMDEGMKFIREALSDESTELAQCLSEALGSGNVDRIKNGQPIFDRNLEGKMRGCFEQFPPQGMGPGGQGGQGGFSGPGGCKSQEECQAYCQENPEECEGFGSGGGQGGFPGGPGGGGSQGGPGSNFPDRGRDGQPVGTQSKGSIVRCDKPQPGFEQYIDTFDPISCLTSYPSNFELICNETHEVTRDNKGGVYCALRQCDPVNGKPTIFTTDIFGRRYCVPPEDLRQQFSPSTGVDNKGEELRRRIQESPMEKLQEGFGAPPNSVSPDQYKQQIPQQYQQGAPSAGFGPSPEDIQKIQQQYQQQIPQQYQQYQNFQPPAETYPVR